MGILKPVAQWRRWCVWFALATLLFASRAPAQSTREEDLKAVFIYNFTSFIDWPEAAFDSPDAPFVIGVVDGEQFRETLEDVVRSETAKGRPIVVRNVRRAADARDAQILFFRRGLDPDSREWLRGLRGAPVLTVGDGQGFVESGGMVGFVTEGNRVRLRLSAPAIEGTGITVSSKLWRLAQVVGERRG